MFLTARRVLLLLWAAAALLVLVRLVRRRILPVEVAGLSMTPALEPGDYILVWRRRLPRDAFGLVAYLRGPDARPLLKRVVGLPGESLRVASRVEPAGRPPIDPCAHDTPSQRDRGVHRLASSEYFVLGDNRAASTDSRDFGPVRATDIEGVAWIRYWPPNRFGWIRRTRRVTNDSAAGPITPSGLHLRASPLARQRPIRYNF